MMILSCILVLVAATALPTADAFFAATRRPSAIPTCRTFNQPICSSITRLYEAEEDTSENDEGTEKKTYDTRVMEMFLTQKYKAFMELLSNQQIWEELQNGEGGYTIFAPVNKVFDDLGEDKLRQLNDPRNLETTEKIGRYHAIPSPVTSKQIFDSNTGGIKTLGGEVPIGKTKSGGFLGFGGEEDGGVTVNGAKILESFEVTNCIVHEVDGLISPQLLWRYMDQLRIPGT